MSVTRTLKKWHQNRQFTLGNLLLSGDWKGKAPVTKVWVGCSEWRVSHILSHHLYPNTLLDIEISLHEPLLQFLPTEGKSLVYRGASCVVFVLYAGLALLLPLPQR